MTLAATPGGLPLTGTVRADGTPTDLLVGRIPGLAFAGIASLGAGAVHAAAAGVHAEHPTLARLFVGLAALQLAVGLWALVRPQRFAAWFVASINAVAVGAWLVTRITGVSWIAGLEVREAPQFADTACAMLGAAAVGTALAAALVGTRRARPPRLMLPSIAVAALVLPAMMLSGTHVHSHGTGTADAAAHDHGTTSPTPGATTGVAPVADESQPHDHGTTSGGTSAVADPATAWPRPWDPTKPIDLSGVPGVTAEQEARAVALVKGTLADLPKYADPATAIANGYASIGDGGTGSEHFMKASLIEDADLLDPAAPESLVYTVGTDGSRTLAGAMYIASSRPADDPSLTGWAGPLMTWHTHDNLCWGIGPDGKPKVVGLTDANGNCAVGVHTGGGNPMVHVWITPNACGVFAALEGVGQGVAAVPQDQRVDTCAAAHNHASTTAATDPKPYDPTLPIDLSGTAGVTPQQQAAAENLVAITVVRLPQWSDYRVAEAAGFQSIGDGATGFEHFIQWSWINDEDFLDPDHPESLVYAPQPDGSKKLVSAMFMLPDTVALADVPDIGGALMQWHIHDNLCFTTDPVAPRVAGLTRGDGTCPPGLVKFRPAPMIHVWITPNACGPFAALEGVGAGQILPGQTRLCDHVHGDGLL